MSADTLPFDGRGLDPQAAGRLGRPGREERAEGGHGDAVPRAVLRPVHARISVRRLPFVKRSRWLLASLLASCLLVAGCSGAKFAYERLDVLLPWYFRGYLDLDSDQRRQLEFALEGLLAWHRASEVGRYAAFLRELEQESAQPLGVDRIRAARLELDGYWDELARRLAPEAATLLSTFSDGQVEHLFARMAKDDEDLAREARGQGPQERQQRRERMLRRQLERWVGRLDERQQALVARCAADLSADPRGWIASRRAWAAELREALAARQDLPRLTGRLEELLADGEVFWDPDYRRQFEADRERVTRLFSDIDQSLTPGQRTALRARLAEWALDLEAIAGGA